MRYLLTIFTLFICLHTSLLAQEYIAPLDYNPVLRYNVYPQPAANKVDDTLILPFIDDFSYQTVHPDANRWMDRQVYVNNTLPANQKSYGVASFDGLNEFGNPYGIAGGGNPVTDGGADTLTSRPIDLSPFTFGVNSLYVQFLYQAGGLGDTPEDIDSLVLEFRQADSAWVKVWGVGGDIDSTDNEQFYSEAVQIDNALYFYKGFQFRFRNRATIIGANDHWHLDYVQLQDTVLTFDFISDVAVKTEPTSVLSRYTMMPWDHFQGYEEIDTASDITFCFNNNYQSILSSFFGYNTTIETNTTPEIEIFNRPATSGNFNFNGVSDTCFTLPTNDIISNIPTISDDSVVLRTSVTINKQTQDITTENDTITHKTEFYNLFAYDDGTAERGYGVAGGGTATKRFAYRFVLNHPDTLRAVLFHFTRINSNPANELFSLFVWKSIDKNNTLSPEAYDTIYYEDFRRPLYVDSINGFATFKVPASFVEDTFYVGWQQIGEKSIEIGLDINNNATNNMFYFANNTWYQSTLYGAPMIRPLVGDSVLIVDSSTGIEDILPRNNISSITVFPNPATNKLFIDMKGQYYGDVEARIYSLSGQLLQRTHYTTGGMDISDLSPSMYIIQVETPEGLRVARFIKQ